MKKDQYTRVSYAQAVYGKKEIDAVVKTLQDPAKISPGQAVAKFEHKVAALFGKTNSVMVNSGSSANLLALEALGFPNGSEVITPALTFATTLAPILQKGLTPVFVDVEPGTYVISVDDITSRITGKTKALMVPSLIGNLPDMKKLRAIAEKYNLFFIEDSCDTLGATFDGKPTGFYSDISTTSFYASHIITAAGSGGMVCFHDKALSDRARILANWGRTSTLFGYHEQSEHVPKRFRGKIGEMKYDAKFIFSECGYNFQSTELSAAFALEQLERLKQFARTRGWAFQQLLNFFVSYEDWFILPKQDRRTKTNWLAFPLTIKEKAPFTRHELTLFLEKRNIQTRPVFTGNALRQPAFEHLARKGQKFPIADSVMERGFLLGAHQGITRDHINHMETALEDFFSKFSST